MKYLYTNPVPMPRGSHYGSDYWVTYSYDVSPKVDETVKKTKLELFSESEKNSILNANSLEITMANKLIECVPNYSEGRDMEKIEKILDNFRGKQDVKLLDYQMDPSHNRLVVTVIGEPAALKDAVVASWGTAVELIDMTKHEGQHPRMGAVDVCPFIPCRNTTVAEADELAKAVAKEVAEKYNVLCFLYEDSASAPHRVNLGTDNLEIANQIARRIRHINGGYRYIKAIGIMLEDRNIAQFSMNLTNYEKTAVYRAFEAVKMEARRYGVPVLESEIVGLLPMQALVDCAEYYLQVENFDPAQVMENRLLEEN